MNKFENPNLSFSGAGFLGIYHVGVASCMLEHCPKLVKNASKIYCCSAGSILGACLLGGLCMGDACEYTLDVVRDATSRFMGPLNPGFRLINIVREKLEENLPPDCYQKCSGKLFISLTKISDGKNYIASEFESNKELIDCIVCSCYIPMFCGIIPPTFRNEYYVDGGLSNNLPQDGNTISIQPWEGQADICPRDNWYSQLNYTIANSNIDFTPTNLYRLGQMLYPSSVEQVSDFCRRGFHDAYDYLKNHDYLVKGRSRRMSFSDEWEEAIERKNKTNHEVIKEEVECDCQESDCEADCLKIPFGGITLDSHFQRDSVDEDDVFRTNLDMPKNVTDRLRKAREGEREFLAKTKSLTLFGVISWILAIPFNFWKDSAKSLIDVSGKAGKFGFDMAVRRLHQRGVIKSSSSMHLIGETDPTPNYSVDFHHE